MGPYVTPHPGRTPGPNVVDREDYKLDVKLTEFKPEQYQLTIKRWIPENGWQHYEYFLTPEELKAVQQSINASK